MPPHAKVIVFEGDDGAGKSTLMHTFADQLRETDKTVMIINQDDLPEFGTKIRDIVINGALAGVSDDVRALMFSAYLLDIWERVINPNLNKVDYILADRSYISTLVYQRCSEVLDNIDFWLDENMKMDVLVYLQMTPGVGIERIRSNREHQLNTIELESTKHDLMERREEYDWRAAHSSAGIVVTLDADKDADTVAEELRRRFFNS